MAHEFACPACGQTVSAAIELIGRSAACPFCTKTFVIPKPGQPAGPSRPIFVVGDRAFTFVCQRCNSILEGRTALCSQRGRCPTCGAEFTIPQVDPHTGSATGPATVEEDGQLPTPVHAYASAGDRAPRIQRLGSGEQVIVCPRCGRQMSIDANLCASCGLPFTIEGAEFVSQTMPHLNAPATAAVILGLLGLLTFCMPVAGAAGVGLGILGLKRARALGPRGQGRTAALLGIVFGGLSLVFAGIYWVVL
jgi:ribosomal protein L37E